MNKPKSEVLAPGVDQIPFEAMERLGAIFAEGEKKYGKDNWKTAPHDKEFNEERTRHAIRHLMLYANGDRNEDHLAKLLWFSATMIWRTSQPGELPDGSPAIIKVDTEPIPTQYGVHVDTQRPMVRNPDGTWRPL